MKTLVIHPEDESTTFLNKVYENIIDKVVVTGELTAKELYEMIPNFDRVMMMGHGSPYGLFNIGFKSRMGHIINHNFVDILKDNPNNVYIWCNADQFVNKHKLKGFFSGMFVSEVGEAYYCGLPGTDQEDIDESNFDFVETVGKYGNETSKVIHENVTSEYGELAKENQVAYYNHRRLYLNE